MSRLSITFNINIDQPSNNLIVKFLDGLGEFNLVNIGEPVNPKTAEIFVEGAKLRKGIDYEIIENRLNSGQFNIIKPLVKDIMPKGDNNVEIQFSR